MGSFPLILLLGLIIKVHGSKFSFKVTDTGDFSISVGSALWFQGEDICINSHYTRYCRNDGSLKKKTSEEINGSDSYGKFKGISIVWEAGNLDFKTNVREYLDGGTIIFEQVFSESSGTSVGDQNKVLSSWPSFAANQYNGVNRGYITWEGAMMGDNVHIGNWNSKSLDVPSGLKDSGPLAVFSTTDCVVISSASEFMSANQYYDENHVLHYGVMGSVLEVPAGFSLETIFSLGSGVSNSMDTWGEKLLKRYGKNRTIANSDFTINYLGYSTDNGAYYYYKTEDNKNYEQTIIDVKTYADKEKIPYRHWLMDSWWYFKGDGNGVKNWTAMPKIFPHGIEYVHDATKWPIVAHNRYWSDNTDYAKQNGGKWDFILEPNSHKGLAFPLQQEFWDWLLSDAKKWGLAVYEQDWLYNEFSEMNCTLSSAILGRQWLMQMGTAAAKNNLTVQYCMSWPRHMLQSVELQAVTQARASGDYHPGNDQWQPLGGTGIFAHAIAIAPTKDNFWSTVGEKGRYGNDVERYNRLQAAVSTLSNGPVAPSDKIGGSDAALIMRSCAADGKLLKPDRPAVKTEQSIFLTAELVKTGPSGDVWQTEVTLSRQKFHYLFAANSKPYSMSVPELTGTSATYRAWEANHTNTPQIFDATHPIALPHTDKWSFNVWTVAPVLSNGWVFMGEANSKWVAVSNDRFTDLVVDKTSVSVTMEGKPGEDVSVFFLAPSTTDAVSVSCTIPSSRKTRLVMPAKTCKPL